MKCANEIQEGKIKDVDFGKEMDDNMEKIHKVSGWLYEEDDCK